MSTKDWWKRSALDGHSSVLKLLGNADAGSVVGAGAGAGGVVGDCAGIVHYS